MTDIFKLQSEGSRTQKIVLSAALAAVAVLLSGFSFPIGPSRCFPFQHAVNVITGVLLGPWWALASALLSATVRNLLGTGTILAYPGSAFGALAVGFAAMCLPQKRRFLAATAEPLATGIVGAWVSSLIVTQAGTGAMFPLLSAAFLASSAPGALIGVLVLTSLHLAHRREASRKESCTP